MVFLLIACSLCSSFGCKKKEPDKVSGIFTFILGNVYVNQRTVKVGAKAHLMDLIEVQEKSSAILQFGNSVLITLGAKSAIKIYDLAIDTQGKYKIGLAQNIGAAFHKIVPGKAEYNVRTPTSVAALRGTSFNLSVEGHKTQIHLLHGKLEIKSLAKSDKLKTESILLEASQKIKTTEDGISQAEPLKDEEKEILKGFDKIALLANEKLTEDFKKEGLGVFPGEIKDYNSKEKSLEEISEDQESKMEQGKQINDKKPLPAGTNKISLSDLRKKYGNLAKIELTDGKTHIGAFKQKGATMEIMTTNGNIIIPSSKIKKISPY
jgi:hypothetical protein